MQHLGDFKLPHFFNYPPYFTLQPVRDTRDKQIQLWKELILDYCRVQKIFVIGLEEDFPLFKNSAIERSLSHEAKEAFLSAIVSDGRAEWMDKSHRRCLILWHRIQDWADIILHFVKENGLEDSVMTVEEIRSGIESRGTVFLRTVVTRPWLQAIVHIARNNTPSLRIAMSYSDCRDRYRQHCAYIHGMDRAVLMRALRLLENRGKLAIFKGTSTDDEGVKFSV